MGTASPAPCARISMLGGFTLTLNGESIDLPPSAQRLVSFLALQRQTVQRAFVAGRLWGDSSEAHAHSSLRSTLWRIQKRAPIVEATGTHLTLSSGVRSDVADALAVRADLGTTSEPPDRETVAMLIQTGELLPGWYDDWLLVERERVRQRRLHALESACRSLTDAGRFADAVDAGLAAIAVEPLRESAHVAVMEAHLAEGNLIEASRQYEQLRDLLRDQLGTRPSPRARQLLHQ